MSFVAEAADISGLERRGRVRHIELTIDAKAVARPRSGRWYGQREPALLPTLHRLRSIDHQIDPLGGWRPQAEGDAATRFETRPELADHGRDVPANNLTDRFGAPLSIAAREECGRQPRHYGCNAHGNLWFHAQDASRRPVSRMRTVRAEAMSCARNRR